MVEFLDEMTQFKNRYDLGNLTLHCCVYEEKWMTYMYKKWII